MAESSLIIRFDDQSQNYTYGFEAGIIWEKMESGVADFNRTIRVENIPVIKRMCNELGYVFQIREYADDQFEGWADIFAIKKTVLNN